MCNPILRVIGLQIPCIERAGVAIDALKLFIGLKYYFIKSLPQSRYLFSKTRDNFYFPTVWFNNNIQEFVQTLALSIEGTPSCIVIYKILNVDILFFNILLVPEQCLAPNALLACNKHHRR